MLSQFYLPSGIDTSSTVVDGLSEVVELMVVDVGLMEVVVVVVVVYLDLDLFVGCGLLEVLCGLVG